MQMISFVSNINVTFSRVFFTSHSRLLNPLCINKWISNNTVWTQKKKRVLFFFQPRVILNVPPSSEHLELSQSFQKKRPHLKFKNTSSVLERDFCRSLLWLMRTKMGLCWNYESQKWLTLQRPTDEWAVGNPEFPWKLDDLSGAQQSHSHMFVCGLFLRNWWVANINKTSHTLDMSSISFSR